jgi:excisionase family DNA binding protein
MRQFVMGLEDKMAFSIPEASAVSSIGRSTLYEAISAGRITTRKAGARTVILRKDLEKYLNALPKGEYSA